MPIFSTMNKIKKLFIKLSGRDEFYLVVLTALAIVTHFAWFDPKSILSFGDWWHWSNSMVKEIGSYWRPWVNHVGFGYANIQISLISLKSIWSFLVKLGLSSDNAIKLTLFIPTVLLGFISPYFLFKHWAKDKLIAFITALFYGTTSYFLIKQTNHILLGFAYAIAPLVFYSFVLALEENTLPRWLIFTLFFTVSIIYEVRISYITSFILFIYFISFYFRQLKKYFLSLTLAGILTLLLNSFWLLPTITGPVSENIASITGRSVWGDFLFDITHAITLQESSWTNGSPNLSFIIQPTLWHFWIVPIIALMPLIFLNKFKLKEKRLILFFGSLTLTGIFLTKQAAHPLAGSYNWLYQNLPGFNLFREASKLFQLTALGYCGLLMFTLLFLKRNKAKRIYPVVAIIVMFTAIWNTKPLLSGEIGGLFTPREIPQDYHLIEKKLTKDQNYYRLLFVPALTRWFPSTNNHPGLDVIGTIALNWANFIQSQDLSGMPGKEDIIQIFEKPYANKLLDMSSIRYVLIPGQSDKDEDDVFSFRDRNRDFFIQELMKLAYLKKTDIGTKNIVFFENFDYKPHLYLTEEKETVYKNVPYQTIDFRPITSTEYQINLNNINKPVYLNFTDAFNPDWKIKAGSFNWLSVLINKDYFLANKNHFKNDAGLNSFYIDPKSICQKYQCHQNPDGSYIIKLTLFFRPEANFLLGLTFSSVTLIGCLIYLIWHFLYEKKVKK